MKNKKSQKILKNLKKQNQMIIIDSDSKNTIKEDDESGDTSSKSPSCAKSIGHCAQINR